MLKVNIDHRRLDKKIKMLMARGVNPTPLMRQIARDMVYSTEENFEREGRPRWKPLSKMTKAILKKEGKEGKMLQRSSAGLASSIHSKVSKTEAIVAAGKDYAPYVQEGWVQMVTKKQRTFLGMTKGIWLKEGTILTSPARPFLKLTREELRHIRERVARFFSGK